MASFRNASEIKTNVLERAGELTDGNSPYDTRALTYINNIQQSIIAGGNEFGIDVDEPWTWAKASTPIVLTLQPPEETGTVTLTLNSTTGTLSSAPSQDVLGWYLKIEGRDEYFRIRYHSTTTIGLDVPYTEASGTFNYKIIKLDYEITDDVISIDTTNNKIDFEEAAGTELTATLTSGVYTPTSLATEIQTQLDSAGGETYAVSFDTRTRKFTLAHGGAFLRLLFATGTNVENSAGKTLGFTQEDKTDQTGSISIAADEHINEIQRIIGPLVVYRDTEINTFYFEGIHNRQNVQGGDRGGKIVFIDENALKRDFPLVGLAQGTPTHCAEISHLSRYGRKTLRFNKFVSEKTKVEVEYIPSAPDLEDNTTSVPLIPLAFRDLLIFGAVYYLMLDKSDNKATTFLQLAQAKLQALVSHNRSHLGLGNPDYGRLIPRRDIR